MLRFVNKERKFWESAKAMWERYYLFCQRFWSELRSVFHLKYSSQVQSYSRVFLPTFKNVSVILYFQNVFQEFFKPFLFTFDRISLNAYWIFIFFLTIFEFVQKIIVVAYFVSKIGIVCKPDWAWLNWWVKEKYL